jgi:hypothetical protein
LILSIGLLKKISQNYCQDNRDISFHTRLINPEKEVLLTQQLDLDCANKGEGYRRPKVYYAAKHGQIIAAEAATMPSRSKITEDPTKRYILQLPNKSHLYVRYKVVKKTMNSDGYNTVKLNNSSERVGCIIQATFSDVNRPAKKTLDHKNGIRDDDTLFNTEWATTKRTSQKSR